MQYLLILLLAVKEIPNLTVSMPDQQCTVENKRKWTKFQSFIKSKNKTDLVNKFSKMQRTPGVEAVHHISNKTVKQSK